MSLHKIITASFKFSTAFILSAQIKVMASCAPVIPFDDTKVFFNKETQEVLTTTGLRFDMKNAGKLIYTQLLQIGHRMTANLVNQEALPDGKLKCHYEMPLHPLSFDADFDPHAPLPTPPMPTTNPNTAPGAPVPEAHLPLPYEQSTVPAH